MTDPNSTSGPVFGGQVTPTGVAIEEMHKLLVENMDNRDFWLDCFPLITGEHLKQYLASNPKGFFSTLKQYDEHINGSLDFSYCDTVASLYDQVFDLAKDTTVETLLLTRLLKMGG